MALKNVWASWGDIHNQEGQVKRINTAKKAEYTPIDIEKNSYSGVFQGKIARYVTSLENCQCMDFFRNGQPCKHIYRLAMELDLIEGEYNSDLKKALNRPLPPNQLTFDEGISLINSVSDEAQQIVKDFLYNHLYQKCEVYGFIKSENVTELIEHNIFLIDNNTTALFDPYGRNEINNMVAPYNIPGFKKNWKKELLVEWIISNHPNIANEITTESIVVTIHPQFTKIKRKVYSHLNQKFQRDLSYLWE